MVHRICFVCLLVATFGAGCASEPSPVEKPERLPGPSKVDVNASLSLDLPGDLAQQYKLPAQVKATLHLKANAALLPTTRPSDSVRSEYHGSCVLLVTDSAGEHRFVDFSTDVDGDGDGTPDEGISSALMRLARSASMMTAPAGPLQGK